MSRAEYAGFALTCLSGNRIVSHQRHVAHEEACPRRHTPGSRAAIFDSGKEPIQLNANPLMEALSDKLALIMGAHLEDESATVDLDKLGGCGNFLAQLGCGQMAYIHQCAHGGFAFASSDCTSDQAALSIKPIIMGVPKTCTPPAPK